MNKLLQRLRLSWPEVLLFVGLGMVIGAWNKWHNPWIGVAFTVGAFGWNAIVYGLRSWIAKRREPKQRPNRIS